MVLARQQGAVEQGLVLVAGPARFWRWLPGYVEERPGYEILNAQPDAATTTKSDFLAGAAWDFLFEQGMDTQIPDRIWCSIMAQTEVRSPWAEMDLRLLDVKGLGSPVAVR